MFEKLQELPLLMGLSINELMSIVEKVKIEFNKWSEGTTLVNQGDRCDRIIYVLSGSICADRRDESHNVLFSEYIDEVPFVLEPQNLWGMKQKFAHTYSFTTDGSTCTIDKRQLSTLISDFEIVKTNILSLVCNRLQSVTTALHQPVPASTESRMVAFIRNNSLVATGRKSIRIKMNVFAEMIDDTRLNVSRVLNKWQDRRLVEIKRGCIEIFDADKLFRQ